jgi:hypothetical protein
MFAFRLSPLCVFDATADPPAALPFSIARYYVQGMSRCKSLLLTCRFHVVLIGLTGVPLSAGTVVIQATSFLPFVPFQPGDSTFCDQSDVGPVSCSIRADFQGGFASAHAEGSTAADFGLISGSILTAATRTGINGFNKSMFGDFVTILGGTGEGTLITHYHLISTGEQMGEPNVPLVPFYRFVQANVAVEHTPALPTPPDGVISTVPEDLDVTSTITFGVPLPLGAGARIAQSYTADSASTIVKSSAQIIGFTVLDSSGHVVADATIQRSFSTSPPDPFAPELGSLAMILTGGAVVILLRRSVGVCGPQCAEVAQKRSLAGDRNSQPQSRPVWS